MRKQTVDLWAEERSIRKSGAVCIVGIDEAGRGPLAGPVVAACVGLPFEMELPDVFDSKQLTESRREKAYAIIQESALGIGVGIVDAEDIDSMNILRATHEAMRCALKNYPEEAQAALIDGLPVRPFPIPQVPLVKGDSRSMSVAAASIIAKVTRDRIMTEYDALYPQYGFAKHKGYPTADHFAMLEKYGVCPIHRKSFAPVTRLLPDQNLFTEVPDLGKDGENAVEQHLKGIGWIILERGFRCREGEIDIVGQEGDVVVFVEVKTRRNSNEAPSESVNFRKRSRLCSAAEHWLYKNGAKERACRFDIAEVHIDARAGFKVNLTKNAFVAGD
jgi:uncharacterized protein (TIGR00252 family)